MCECILWLFMVSLVIAGHKILDFLGFIFDIFDFKQNVPVDKKMRKLRKS